MPTLNLKLTLTSCFRRPPISLPSVQDTLKHPAYPSTIWQLEPHQRGKLAAAKGLATPVNIAWEIHGEGPIKIVVCLINTLCVYTVTCINTDSS